MKRKLITLTMTTLMMLSAVTGVMAEENISAEKSKSAVVTSSTYSESSRIALPENLDSLSVNKVLETDRDGATTLIGGNIPKELFKEILDSLNKGEDEKAELLKQFDENLEINKRVNELYKGAENKSESELQEIYNQADEIYKNKHNLFDDEIIEKALEMKIINKIHLEIEKKNGIGEDVIYSIKSN